MWTCGTGDMEVSTTNMSTTITFRSPSSECIMSYDAESLAASTTNFSTATKTCVFWRMSVFFFGWDLGACTTNDCTASSCGVACFVGRSTSCVFGSSGSIGSLHHQRCRRHQHWADRITVRIGKSTITMTHSLILQRVIQLEIRQCRCGFQ